MTTHYTAHVDTTTGARTLHTATTVPARPTHADTLAVGGDALHAAHVALGMVPAAVTGRTGTDALNAGVDGTRYRSASWRSMPHRARVSKGGALRLETGTEYAVSSSRLADVTPRDDAHAAELISAMVAAQARLLAKR